MAKGVARSAEAEAERRRKISEARKRKMQELGYLNSAEARRKIGLAGARRVTSEETKAKQSAAKKGKRPANFALFLAAAHASPKKHGAENPSWKGDAAGYQAMHAWVRRVMGRPSKCERCGTEAVGRYEWANKSREYRRDVTDWERLCVSCHRKDGYAFGEYCATRAVEIRET